MSNSKKVIVLGLNKTGTKSLSYALSHLGFKKRISYSEELSNLYSKNNTDKLIQIATNFEVIEDLPWPLIWNQLYHHFNEAYFILSKRKTSEVWYNSQVSHFLRHGPKLINEAAYGSSNPIGNKKKYISIYESHNYEIESFFKDKPNFNTITLDNGEGWEVLCSLLNEQMPNISFPFRNADPKRQTLPWLLKYKFNKILDTFKSKNG